MRLAANRSLRTYKKLFNLSGEQACRLAKWHGKPCRRKQHALVRNQRLSSATRGSLRWRTTKPGERMKIAVEITIFGHVFSEVVDYPGTPKSHAEVIQWLIRQTDFKWCNYEGAPAEDKLIYDLEPDLKQ
jgi:hypothetical protein